ncbi:hypothetical protein N665_0009s0137 [Sinapis alba]|nr:hypothetical protein N665_0009s0137 [Sinapis alba]
MAARSTSALLLSCMLYCVFVLLVTNLQKAEGGKQLPVCGNKEGCGGVWCKDEKRPGKEKCIMWPCDFMDDCMKILICGGGLQGPYCMEAICTCYRKNHVYFI